MPLFKKKGIVQISFTLHIKFQRGIYVFICQQKYITKDKIDKIEIQLIKGCLISS